MSGVVAVLEQDDDPRVLALATTVAALLGGDVRRLHVPPDGDRADAVASALHDDEVAVLGAGGPESVCWEVVRRVVVPLVVLPHHARVPARVAEVLLPLDGAAPTASAVAGMAGRLVDAGAHLRAMHVFDADTAPAFWDQAAHSHEHWTEEFLLRNLPAAVDLDLRRGRTGDEVVAEAERSGADLVMIGWAQDLGDGRARTVRRALTAGRVPILLLPVATGPSSPGAGPCALDPASARGTP